MIGADFDKKLLTSQELIVVKLNRRGRNRTSISYSPKGVVVLPFKLPRENAIPVNLSRHEAYMKLIEFRRKTIIAQF